MREGGFESEERSFVEGEKTVEVEDEEEVSHSGVFGTLGSRRESAELGEFLPGDYSPLYGFGRGWGFGEEWGSRDIILVGMVVAEGDLVEGWNGVLGGSFGQFFGGREGLVLELLLDFGDVFREVEALVGEFGCFELRG